MGSEMCIRDRKNVVVEVRAGTGGDEASIFSGDLYRMYTRYVEKSKWQLEILSSSVGEHGGFKEIIARISGTNVYSKLKFEDISSCTPVILKNIEGSIYCEEMLINASKIIPSSIPNSLELTGASTALRVTLIVFQSPPCKYIVTIEPRPHCSPCNAGLS